MKKTDETTSETIGLKEAARRVRVSPDTIRRRLHAGQFPNARKTDPDDARSAWEIPVAEVKAAFAEYPAGPGGRTPLSRRATSHEGLGGETSCPDNEPAALAAHVKDLRAEIVFLRSALERAQEGCNSAVRLADDLLKKGSLP